MNDSSPPQVSRQRATPITVTASHLIASLDKFKVPDAEKQEVLAAVGSLKKDIVEK